MSWKVTQVRIFRYHSKFFLDRKFTVRTIHHVLTFSWKYSSWSCRFQWPVSRKAVLFHAFISAVNNTNYSSYRVVLDNHRQCLSTMRQHRQHRQVDRFKISFFSMSTGFALYVDRFKVLRVSMSIFALFPVYMSTGLCNYGVMLFYVVIFNPDVSMYIQS